MKEEKKKKNKQQKSPSSTDANKQKHIVHLLPSDSKRCRRCGKYYTDNAETACVYHSGIHSNMKFHPHWSCCGQTNPQSPGCTSGVHLEDVKTSIYLSERAVVNEPVSIEIEQPQVEEHDSTDKNGIEEENEVYLKKADGTIYYKHRVLPTETLRGISIKYGVNSTSIKKANHIFGNDNEIHLKDTLLIPWDKNVSDDKVIEFPTHTYDDLIQQFRGEFHISIEEARFYLSDAEWDISLARDSFSKDLEFEKNHSPIAANSNNRIQKRVF